MNAPYPCRHLRKVLLIAYLACGSLVLGRPRSPMPPLPHAAPVLFMERWDEPLTLGITDAAVLRVEDCGDLVESWSGYGLSRSGMLVPPCTLPGLDEQGRALISPASGAVSVWLTPEWSSGSIAQGSGPGVWGVILEMAVTDWQTAPLVCWWLVVNPDGMRISLAAQTDGGPVELLGCPIEWAAYQTHLVTLNFGTEGTELYLDGELAALGGGTPETPPSSARLTVGSSFTGTQAPGCTMDELYSFGRSLAADEVEFYYNGNARQAALGPITPEEDLVRAEWLEAVRSQPLSLMQFDAMTFEMEGSGLDQYEQGTLWVEITGVTSNEVSVLVHGTVLDEVYELQSKTNLTDTLWIPETEPFLGLEGETPVVLPVGDRTNRLFLRARSWVDTDGVGMPDWWQLQWFGEIGIDPYGDPDGDGWVTLQEYQNGTDPRYTFNTPAPPQGFEVYISQGTNVFIQWLQSQAVAQGYELQKDEPGVGGGTISLPGATTSYPDTLIPQDPNYLSPQYRVRSLHGANGPSPWTDWVKVRSARATVFCDFLRDRTGRNLVLMAGAGPEIAGVRLTRIDTSVFPEQITVFDLPLSSFTNGLSPLPESWIEEAPNALWYAQGLTASEEVGETKFYLKTPAFAAFDGREALYQNLTFQMRAANSEEAFGFGLTMDPYALSSWWLLNPNEYAYSSYWPTQPTSYKPLGYGTPELNPFFLNHLYRNWAYDPGHLSPTSGWPTTGAGIDYGNNAALLYPGTNELAIPQGLEVPTCVLSTNATRWTFFRPLASYDTLYLETLGLTEIGNNLVMDPGASNLFGLRYEEIKLVWGDEAGQQLTILPGNTVAFHDGALYPNAEQPVLETQDYYFAMLPDGFPAWASANIPGMPEFSSTSVSPVLIASLGKSCRIAGYSKQRIVNGAQDKFGYLGQYLRGRLQDQRVRSNHHEPGWSYFALRRIHSLGTGAGRPGHLTGQPHPIGRHGHRACGQHGRGQESRWCDGLKLHRR